MAYCRGVRSNELEGPCFMHVVERIGRDLVRHVRNGFIVRAFAVLPSIKRNDTELLKLLER